MASAAGIHPGNSNSVTSALSRPDVVIALVLFLVSLAYFSLTITRGIELRDEGYILHRSARVAEGEIPHRDFTAVYGPGVYAAGAQVIKLFGRDIVAIRILLAALKGVAVVLTFLIVRFFATRPFALFGALLAAVYWGRVSWNLNAPYAALYTIPLCLLAVFILIRGLHRRSALAIFGSGVVVGAALLFKQSLAIFSAYGMVLAVWGVGMLKDRPGRNPSFEKRLSLVLWFLAGAAILVPFIAYMSWRNYFLHFLPLHLPMILVAAAIIRRGSAGSPGLILKNRILPFVLGFGVFPGATALVYAWWGALDELIFNMFIFPQTFINYYIPVNLPPSPFLLLLSLIVAVGAISTILILLRNKTVSAFILGTGTIGIACVLLYRTPGTDKVSSLVSFLGAAPLWSEQVLLVSVSLTALVILSPSFFRAARPRGFNEVHVFLPLLFFHAILTFQTFPRATYNYMIIQGALVPLLTLVLFAWYRLGVAKESGAGRRSIAALVTFLLPFWFVNHLARETLAPITSKVSLRPLNLPSARGIGMGQREYRTHRIDEFEQLIAYLRTAEPGNAPVFLLTNQEMILYVSRRDTLFPERECYLFLIGWGLYPSDQIQKLNVNAMIRRLRERPDAILIDREDEHSGRLRASMPALGGFIDREYEVEARIGLYTILRHKQGSGILDRG